MKKMFLLVLAFSSLHLNSVQANTVYEVSINNKYFKNIKTKQNNNKPDCHSNLLNFFDPNDCLTKARYHESKMRIPGYEYQSREGILITNEPYISTEHASLALMYLNQACYTGGNSNWLFQLYQTNRNKASLVAEACNKLGSLINELKGSKEKDQIAGLANSDQERDSQMQNAYKAACTNLAATDSLTCCNKLATTTN